MKIKCFKVFSAFCFFLPLAAQSGNAIETPTGIVFDEVSSTTIVASGYAATPAFSGLETGLAGVAVAKNGTYSAWRNGNKWTTKTAMPTGRWNPSAGIIGGKLFAVGGRNAGYLDNNEEYDPVADAWTIKAGMPTARQQFSIGVIGGKLYAVGGHNGRYLNANEEYDPEMNTWTAKAGMPEARDGFCAGVISGKLYAAGGAYLGNGVNTNFEYDPALNTWKTKAPMSTARYYLAAGVIGGKLYAVGGALSGGGDTPINEEYDPISNTWSTKEAMPTPRGNFTTGVIGGKLYAVGGEINPVSGKAHVNANEEYDPASNTWSIKAGMPTPRSALSAGVIGGKLYAVGGYSGADGYLDTNEAYDPGVASAFTSLTPNTLYGFKAKARDASGVETAESPAVSTYTLAALPAAGSPVFTPVGSSSLALQWRANGNPRGTLYRAQLSASGEFTSAASSDTYSTSAVFTRLSPGIPYYARVAAMNGNGIWTSYAALGSTRLGAVEKWSKPRQPVEEKAEPRQPVEEKIAPRAPDAVPAGGPVVSPAKVKTTSGGINVAVAEFTGKNVSQADASIVADFLRTALVATKQVSVMDRNNMDTVLAEQKFQNSGCTDQQCAVEMGKLLSVNQMLVGSLSKLLDTYYITVNVVDVETGKIIASYDADAGNSKELKTACKKIVEKITKK
ncbi:MAG: CsgG/HfaB family protein [Elusimicrobiota bacterium]|nr:CsgG/HfaB family protein [Elusimicrobiota bacterium]